MYVAFRFWRKANYHFRGNQRSCSSKNLDCRFLCSTKDKMLGNKFLKLCFFLWSCFWSHSRNNLVSPHMACSKFRRVNSCVKTKSATSRNLFADRRAGFSVVFSYCIHKMKYICCPVFSVCFSKLNCLFGFSSRKVSQRSGFIDGWVLDSYASSYHGQQEKSKVSNF